MLTIDLITTLKNENTSSEELHNAITAFEKQARLVSPKTDGILYSFTYYRPMFFGAGAGFVCEYTIYNDNTYSDVVMDAYDDSKKY